ncbi:MAG: S41 family peptidase [Terracidiphilus sp.]
MRHTCGYLIVGGLMLSAFVAIPLGTAQQEGLNRDEQHQISGILRDAHDVVKKNYYDPKLQGLDWDARYQHYAAMVGQAHSIGEGFRIVAAFLSGLKDSHTYFVPPTRSIRYDSGYRFELIGDRGFITQIRPNTEAAEKLHIGDQIVHMDNYNVNREDFLELSYYYNILAPRISEQLDLRSPSGEMRRVVVNGIARTNKRVLDFTDLIDFYDLVRQSENQDHATRPRIVEMGDAAIWKPQWFDPELDQVERSIGIARKHKALILDLRGNPGGSVETLKWIVGMLSQQDVKIADRVSNKESKPLIAKHDGKPFTGKLMVLVDGGSASAAEALARVIQLEHRGTAIGDRTAGAVMEAREYPDSQGADIKIFYGFSVTDANLVMSDGKSLEKTGVVPDELLLPTGADLAAGRDIVLARAAELAGIKLDPVEAGKLLPFEWVPLPQGRL